MKKQNYFEPAIEVIEMAVESGIAASNVEHPGFDPDEEF